MLELVSSWDSAILLTAHAIVSRMLWLKLLVYVPFSFATAQSTDEWLEHASSSANLDDLANDFPKDDSPFQTPVAEHSYLLPFDNTPASQVAQQGTPGIIRLADSRSHDHTPVPHIARKAHHVSTPYPLLAPLSQPRATLSHDSADFGLTQQNKSHSNSGHPSHIGSPAAIPFFTFNISPVPELTVAVSDIAPIDWAHFRRAFNDYNNTFSLVQDDLTFKQNNTQPPLDPKDLAEYNKKIGSVNMLVGALGIAEHTLGDFVNI